MLLIAEVKDKKQMLKSTSKYQLTEDLLVLGESSLFYKILEKHHVGSKLKKKSFLKLAITTIKQKFWWIFALDGWIQMSFSIQTHIKSLSHDKLEEEELWWKRQGIKEDRKKWGEKDMENLEERTARPDEMKTKSVKPYFKG